MWRVLVVMMIAPALASAEVVPERVVVVGRVDAGAWSDAPSEARIDQKVELAPVVFARDGRRRVVLAPKGVVAVRVNGRKYKVRPLGAARVQWSTVEPHGFRAKPAKNGVTTEFYSNVSMESKTFGRWLGYDEIDYFERVVRPWSTEVAPLVARVESDEQQVPGLGTMRFKVEVELGGVRVASPGKEARDRFGLLRTVHRVSIRRADDFLGYLSAYLLVPEVFGSAGGGANHQTERFTGADCADVMVGAARRMGKRLWYTNVASLTTYARPIAKATEVDETGMPATPITGVLPGDLIRIDYGGSLRGHTPRAFDHVAALWEDKSAPDGPHKGGPNGQLDGFDLVIHMGHPRLKIEPLSGQSPATIDVLRWRR